MASQASTFTWTKLSGGNASGSWATQGNWSGGVLPTSSSDTANFTTLNPSVDSTVTLDGNQTINTLLFSDTNTATAASWIIAAGTPSSSTLTLAGANPTIDVTGMGSGKAAVINAVVIGAGGLTKSGTSFLQLNGTNPYSGGTIISGSDCRISAGNAGAFGTGTVQVGGPMGDGQIWFNAAGNLTLTNAFEIRTTRWIIDGSTVNGVAAGDLTVNGSVLFNTGASGVRDVYCNKNLTLNGNVSVTPATNPINKQGGYVLTLNGTNTIGGASGVNGGTLVINGPLNGGTPIAVNNGGALVVNGIVNSASTVTVNSGGGLSGAGNLAGLLLVTNGGNLTPGNGSSGTLTCGRLISYAGANFNFNFGSTNNPTNGLIKVSNGVTLAGSLNITDLGGFSSGVYTGLQYSGALTLNGFTNGNIAGGKTVLVDTNSAHGYVLFRVLNGLLNPTAGQGVPMDLASPLALSWVEVPGATAYDVYLGTVSNAVARATTNTAGIYQGRSNALTLNISSVQPNTTYYWRVDGLAANGTITNGMVYSFTTGATMTDLMQDTWVATDALNRTLPGVAECGSPRTNQPIGIFYFLWHTTNSLGTDGPRDNTREIQRLGGYADPHNPWASNPLWMSGANARSWYWSEPENGYYSVDDEWVIRRHLALLEAAGVDVLGFDSTNGHPETQAPTFLKIMAVIRKMRMEGTPVHIKVFFYTHATSPATVNWLYNNLYSPGLYRDLWFMWQGKPVIIGYPDGTVASGALNFFTWRTGWANASSLPADEWQWIDTPTRQNYGYDTRTDLAEQMPMTCGGWANGNLGRSYANGSQSAYNNYHLTIGRTEGLGIQFSEQAFQGLKVDPQFLWVVGWNEWWAGAWDAGSTCYTHLLADCCDTGNRYFVDNYNAEYSRDIEPVKGGFTDNYYYQLVRYARQRKGVRPIPAASAPRKINLAGDFSDWTNVGPAFLDPVSDTLARNWPSTFGNLPNYTNNTGRNDFTVLKVARDANSFYFLAQCNSNLTSYTGTNWMVLFMDTDQNYLTGWEGYDYAVNLGPRTASTTTLSQNLTTTNGWTWATARTDIAYKVTGNQLMLAIPRTALGLGADPVQFDFHWADNFQTNDIADFGPDGDSAPDRRFNYRYLTTTNTELILLADDFENGKQSIWAETWTNGSLWNITSANPYAGNYCAVCTNGAGQSNLIARVSTAGYGSLRLNFHYKLHNVKDAQNLKIYYQGTNGWVAIRELSRDEYYPASQAWGYDEQQEVWLNFVDTRLNSGPDATFFSTNFAFRIDGSAVSNSTMSVWIDDVALSATTALPAPVAPPVWQTRDIGNAGNAGSVATNASTFTVTGSGQDIWNSGDSCRLLYQTRTGDGTLTARVASQTPADGWSKAGVMIRESTDTGARNAFMTITPGNGATFQRRVATLGASDFVASAGPVAPYWVRLARVSGTNLTGYFSANGATWTLLGATNLANFNATALWGLAVTAHNNNTNSTAVFDHVTVAQAPVIAPVRNQTLTAGQTLTLTNTILNPDTPPLVLTWNLLSAPPGLTLGAASGVLNWRPAIPQSPATNLVSFSVTDSSSPPLSATQQFAVAVLRPASPPITQVMITNGMFSLLAGGDVGPDYTLLGATNLTAPISWLPLLTITPASLPVRLTHPSPMTNQQFFYRVLLGP